MANLTATLAARLAVLYAGNDVEQTPPVWDPNELFRAETPAATFMSMHQEHAFAKFLVEFRERYKDAARGGRVLTSDKFADIPFIGAKVLTGEPPVVVISKSSYSPRPGSVSLWAMLFPFDPTAPEEYATTREWKLWRSKYPKYRQVLCGNDTDPSFGLDPESLIVTDACLPSGCGNERDERVFLNKFIDAIPKPKMVLSLGGDAAKRLKMYDLWHRLRDQQSRGVGIKPDDAMGYYMSTDVPVVVSPFVWGHNAKDRRGPHFTAAVAATRSRLCP